MYDDDDGENGIRQPRSPVFFFSGYFSASRSVAASNTVDSR